VKFEDQFEEFLEKTVNLSPGRLALLEQRVEVIEGVLGASSDDDLVVIEARPQGSFAQKTIINPKDDTRGFDADLLVEFEEHGAHPAELLKAVEGAIKESHHHADLVRRRTRCVTLEYAGEFHLDVVPCVRQGPIPYIANRQTDGWEPTDPDGLTAWMEEHDARANGHLVPAIRLCKFLRDYKGRPKVKSVVLTLVLAQMVERRLSTDFTDLPTTLMLLLESLADWASMYPSAPYLAEPTCGAELRVGDMDWGAFTRQITSLAKRAREAYDEESEEKSLALWRRLFGKRFPGPELRVAEAALVEGEMDLYKDLGIPTELSEIVKIAPSVRPKDGFRKGSFAALSPLQKRRDLDFRIVYTNVQEPFDVYWKVKNRGQEAADRNALRGEIRRDDRAPNAHRHESTLYTGTHYIEVYIVKDGICVAKDRLDVPIA
jgi:hypothetical protein